MTPMFLLLATMGVGLERPDVEFQVFQFPANQIPRIDGETDDWCYNIVDKSTKGVHIHDLNATILHLLGIDHERLTYRFQGRHYRLTDVHGKVVKGVLA